MPFFTSVIPLLMLIYDRYGHFSGENQIVASPSEALCYYLSPFSGYSKP